MAKIIARNKTATFNYEVVTKYLAGIELQSWEVKSIRNQNVDLKGAFCLFKNDQLFVINMHISKYMHLPGEEMRARKLLLNKNELKKIKFKQITSNLSIIPLMLLNSPRNFIKLEIVLGKPKTKYDKRQTIKKRQLTRELKNNY